jgi:hypothetical protein
VGRTVRTAFAVNGAERARSVVQGKTWAWPFLLLDLPDYLHDIGEFSAYAQKLPRVPIGCWTVERHHLWLTSSQFPPRVSNIVLQSAPWQGTTIGLSFMTGSYPLVAAGEIAFYVC